MEEKDANNENEDSEATLMTESTPTDPDISKSPRWSPAMSYSNDPVTIMNTRPSYADINEPDNLWSIPWSNLMMVLFAILFLLIGMQSIDESAPEEKTFIPENISTIIQPEPALIEKKPVIKNNIVTSSAAEETKTSSQVVLIEEPESNKPQASLIMLAKIRESILEKNSRHIIATLTDNNSIKINLAGSLLFEPGQSSLSKTGKQSLKLLIPPLSETPYQINIVGHTDDASIDTTRYKDKWELSLVRASTVARFLIQSDSIEAHKLTIMGRAQYDPVAANLTAESRALNRRVEIIITQKHYRPLEDRL